MPFRSVAQLRFMFKNHPRIAKRWTKKYGVPKKLPKKTTRSKQSSRSRSSS